MLCDWTKMEKVRSRVGGLLTSINSMHKQVEDEDAWMNSLVSKYDLKPTQQKSQDSTASTLPNPTNAMPDTKSDTGALAGNTIHHSRGSSGVSAAEDDLFELTAF